MLDRRAVLRRPSQRQRPVTRWPGGLQKESPPGGIHFYHSTTTTQMTWSPPKSPAGDSRRTLAASGCGRRLAVHVSPSRSPEPIRIRRCKSRPCTVSRDSKDHRGAGLSQKTTSWSQAQREGRSAFGKGRLGTGEGEPDGKSGTLDHLAYSPMANTVGNRVSSKGTWSGRHKIPSSTFG